MDKSTLRTSKIRFTQDSIKSSFQDGGSVNDAAENVCSGTKSVNEFPPIQVVKQNNKYYSFDNRRLYVFRVAAYRGFVTHIPVKIVAESRLDLDRFTTENDGRTVQVRGDGRTLPHCKEHWLRKKREKERKNQSSAASSSATKSHNNTPKKITASSSRTTTRKDRYSTFQRPPRYEVTPAVDSDMTAVWNSPRYNMYRDANPVYIDIPDDPEEDGGYFGRGFRIPKWCMCLCFLLFILGLFDRSDD